MRELKQSTAANLAVFMTDSSDHVTGKAGLTLAITASKDGAGFASISPTVTELTAGWYKVALTSSHTDTLGDLAIHVTATGADATDFVSRIIAMDKADSVRAGLTALPNVASGNAGAVLTSGTGTAQLNVASGKAPATLASTDVTGNLPADVQTIKTQAVTCAAGVTVLASVGTAASFVYTAPLDAAGVRTAVGLATASLDTQLAAINTKTTNLPSDPADASDVAAAFATVNSTLATIAGYTDSIESRLPAALVGGRMDCSVGAYQSGQDPATLVLDATATAHNTAGTIGAKVNAAGSATDPWATVAVNTTTFAEIQVALAAVLLGKRVDSATHATTTFSDVNDPATPRVTSTNTSTTRTPTLH